MGADPRRLHEYIRNSSGVPETKRIEVRSSPTGEPNTEGIVLDLMN